MAKGLSINLDLLDRVGSGRIKATINFWLGQVYRIPRSHLDLCDDLDVLKLSGIYFLFGFSRETGNDFVHVGQASVRKMGEGLLERLQGHDKDDEQDYWTDAVVISTSNFTNSPVEISYLENRLCNLAITANRYEVKNDSSLHTGLVSEEKQSELEEFIENSTAIISALGFKVFEPELYKSGTRIRKRRKYRKSSDTKKEGEKTAPIRTNPLLHSPVIDTHASVLYSKDRKFPASGRRTSSGFMVLAGSKIAKETSPDCPQKTILFRQKYASKINRDNQLLQDVLFPSPTAAASFVTGDSADGSDFWVETNGRTLQEIERGDESATKKYY